MSDVEKLTLEMLVTFEELVNDHFEVIILKIILFAVEELLNTKSGKRLRAKL
jgi:hypothetical protein